MKIRPSRTKVVTKPEYSRALASETDPASSDSRKTR
jgi:hypothetical protein